MKSDALARIVEVIRKSPAVCLATTDGVTPRARYISVREVDDDLTITFATGMTDAKTVHIKKNPRVSVIAGFPPPEPGMPNVSVDAVATIHTDRATREKYWEESFLEHFSGPDHEHYVILRLRPTRAWISTGEEIVDFPEAEDD
jgi:general stress protein 26